MVKKKRPEKRRLPKPDFPSQLGVENGEEGGNIRRVQAGQDTKKPTSTSD